jgi:putative YphP/YqiW family bacilliredoxin
LSRSRLAPDCTAVTGYPPSSPSIALLRNGEIVYMLQRSDIESRDALTIAEKLTPAFDEHCAAPVR